MCVLTGVPGVCEHGESYGSTAQVCGEETSRGGAGGQECASAHPGPTPLLTVSQRDSVFKMGFIGGECSKPHTGEF